MRCGAVRLLHNRSTLLSLPPKCQIKSQLPHFIRPGAVEGLVHLLAARERPLGVTDDVAGWCRCRSDHTQVGRSGVQAPGSRRRVSASMWRIETALGFPLTGSCARAASSVWESPFNSSAVIMALLPRTVTRAFGFDSRATTWSRDPAGAHRPIRRASYCALTASAAEGLG